MGPAVSSGDTWVWIQNCELLDGAAAFDIKAPASDLSVPTHPSSPCTSSYMLLWCFAARWNDFCKYMSRAFFDFRPKSLGFRPEISMLSMSDLSSMQQVETQTKHSVEHRRSTGIYRQPRSAVKHTRFRTTSTVGVWRHL